MLWESIFKTIVAYYGVQDFVQSRTAFIVIPLFAGGDLKRLLAAHKSAGTRLAEEKILSYLCQMLDAVAKISQCNNAHRDLKPDNVRQSNTTQRFRTCSCRTADASRQPLSADDSHLTRALSCVWPQIFFTGSQEDLALADFGEVGSKQLEFTKGVTSPGGSPACLAPEVLDVSCSR